MSVRGTDEERLERRLVVSARVIDEGIGAERAELRTTAVYRFTPWLQAGVEYNPRADDWPTCASGRRPSTVRP